MPNLQGQKTRILVVDDSPVARGIWTRILEEQPDFAVADRAANGLQALQSLRKVPVEVVLLDLEMPEMDGLTAIPLIRKEFPQVKIIVASALTTHGSKAALEAMALGAVDSVPKPSVSGGSLGVLEVSRDLAAKIRAHAIRLDTKAVESRKPRSGVAASVITKRTATPFSPEVLGIGTSTGGPVALQTVLSALSPEFRLPILVVQHMPRHFTTALAESIAKNSGRDCKEAAHGDAIERGKIYIAPGDYHMTVACRSEKCFIELNQNPPESFCRPSVNPLFRSLAAAYGKKTLGVVLTGLGDDGKNGCVEIVKHGGQVIVQDEATSVVWGMPGSVARAGLASAILPLGSVAAEIERLASVRQRNLGR